MIQKFELEDTSEVWFLNLHAHWHALMTFLEIWKTDSVHGSLYLLLVTHTFLLLLILSISATKHINMIRFNTTKSLFQVFLSFTTINFQKFVDCFLGHRVLVLIGGRLFKISRPCWVLSFWIFTGISTWWEFSTFHNVSIEPEITVGRLSALLGGSVIIIDHNNKYNS